MIKLDDILNEDNGQTYREFIRESEREFFLPVVNVDSLSEEDLVAYLEFLDGLWLK